MSIQECCTSPTFLQLLLPLANLTSFPHFRHLVAKNGRHPPKWLHLTHIHIHIRHMDQITGIPQDLKVDERIKEYQNGHGILSCPQTNRSGWYWLVSHQLDFAAHPGVLVAIFFRSPICLSIWLSIHSITLTGYDTRSYLLSFLRIANLCQSLFSTEAPSSSHGSRTS